MFDVSTITNGMNATNVLGQTTFSGASTGNSASTFNRPQGLVYDADNQRLFVAENSSNRVKVFDVSSITNGEDAIDLLGQYDSTGSLTVSYTKAAAHNAPNEFAFSSPLGVALDAVHHRLFLVESTNNRVLAYNLTTENVLSDKTPAHVLGQTTFGSSSSGNSTSTLNGPVGLAYDADNDQLFVAENGGNRVKVFDTSSLTDGEEAIHVLGQTTFSGASSGNSTSTLNTPVAVAYDTDNDRLFVAENLGHRVKVFDTSSITDGEEALYVLGQTTFSGAGSGNSTSTFNAPFAVAYDVESDRLFVAENLGNRVKVFNVATSTIASGMSATHVLGQMNFSDSSSGDSASTFNRPQGLSYDAQNDRLFVAENNAHRVKVFTVATSTIANGMDAVNVIGQTTFSGASSGNSATTLNGPRGLVYDADNDRLFVTEPTGNRVKIFDVAPPDTTAPDIASIAAGSLTTSGAIITWATDEDSTSQVQYGLTISYGSLTAVDPTATTSHSVVLSGLVSGTIYHFQVISADSSGNSATSSDQTFTIRRKVQRRFDR